MNTPKIDVKNFYNTFNAPDVKGKDVKMNDEIKSLIQSAKEASDYNEICTILDNAVTDNTITQRNPVSYITNDYVITNMLKYYADNYLSVLKKLSEKELSIVPQYVDSVTNGNHTILFTKIPGMNGKELIPYSEGAASLSDDAKQEAYKDIQKLLKAGLVNNAMLRSTSNWYITPETKKIIIPDWSSMRIIEDNERAPILNQMHRFIFGTDDKNI